MKYAYIQRKEHEPFITIGEYIQLTAPEVFAKLLIFLTAAKVHDVTETALTAANLSFKDMYYARVMTERPLPGHGGLLPGEGKDALYD